MSTISLILLTSHLRIMMMKTMTIGIVQWILAMLVVERKENLKKPQRLMPNLKNHPNLRNFEKFSVLPFKFRNILPIQHYL